MPRRCSLLVFHGSGSPDVGVRIMLADGHGGVGRRKFTTGLREAAEGQPVIKDRSVEQRQLARRVEQMQFGQSQPELDLVAWPQAMIRADDGQEPPPSARARAFHSSSPRNSTTSARAGIRMASAGLPLPAQVLRPEADGQLGPVVQAGHDLRPCHSGQVPVPRRAGRPLGRGGTKFIAGDPMNPATKMLAGRISLFRVPTCWRTPSRMIAIRSPMVMASTWSCVT